MSGTNTTPFYYMVSTSVGSGKTTAAIKMIVDGAPNQNYIYVVPTMLLGEQTEEDIKLADDGHIHGVERIDSSKYSESVALTAKQRINQTPAELSKVFIITTGTFLNIVADIENKDGWVVFLDEAFEPFTLTSLGWGSAVQRDLLMDLFKGGKDGNLRPVDTSKVKAIARGAYHNEWAYEAPKAKMLCTSVMNKALYCSWVDTGDEKGSFASYVKPSALQGFKSAYFMAALFKDTILYHLWTNKANIDHAEFRESPHFSDSGMIDVHKEQGLYINVGYLLHPDDNVSKKVLYRNATTGEPWGRFGTRVIDKCLDQACAMLGDVQFLWTANNGYVADEIKLPRWSLEVPGGCRGLNDYKHHTDAVALSVTNPKPSEARWLRDNTGLSNDDVHHAFRIHAIYQFFGRTAIRVRGDSQSKTFLCAGRKDAEFINKLFIGSTFLGHVGNMPSISKLVRSLNASNPRSIKVSKHPDYKAADSAVKNIRKRVNRGTATKAELDAAIVYRDTVKARLKAAPVAAQVA